MAAGDWSQRTRYHYTGTRYEKVPFKNYTIVRPEKGLALFFGKDDVDRAKILNFLNRALVVAGTNRKINKKLPQDIDYKNKEVLKQLQSMFGKEDFSCSRSIIQYRYYGTSWQETIYPHHKK